MLRKRQFQGLFISCSFLIGFSSNVFAFGEVEVAASIGKEVISYQSIEEASAKEIYEAKLKLYEVRMNQLKQLLVSKLVQLDPRSKGLTEETFLANYVVKPTAISEAQIRSFAQQQKIDPAKLDDSLKQRIQSFLVTQSYSQQIDEWFKRQAQIHQVKINLKKPDEPVYQVSIGNSAVLGNAKAKVTIVEFSDFECPYCAKGNETLKLLKNKYGEQLRIVFKNFPLSFHPNAEKAAEAGLCALNQGNDYFWKLHDLMFENQRNLSLGVIKDHAKLIGLAMPEFSECLKDGKFAEQVKLDTQEGMQIGVSSTPAYFINGQMITGAQPLEAFVSKIEAILVK